MTTRACIYARYSTDRQAETSLEDQVRLCRTRCRTAGWVVVAEHSDGAVSGSTHVDERPGGAALLDDAWAGAFDVLVLEGLDRLSRDQVEQERIVRRLEHRGMRIVGLADGYDSTMGARKVLRGVRGLINEMYLDDLRHKTHRGQAGQVARGFVAGGKSYGYDLVRREQGSTYRINADQAGWVRWIFRGYADGAGVAALAHELNRRGVPSPRGTSWAVSAIYGSPAKGSGILNNPLYMGQYVWNRSRWVKDPDTGRRARIDRPRDEWQTVAVPDLRIVDDETWGRVRARIDAGRDKDGRKQFGRQARTLFGGLLVCPHCGGAMVATSATMYGCAARKDRGPAVCRGLNIRRDLVDRRLVSVVRDDLLSQERAARFEMLFRDIAQRRMAGGEAARRQAADRAEKLDQEIARVVDAITAVGASEALADRLRRLEGDRAQARDLLLALHGAEAVHVPAVGAIYRRILMQLSDQMEADTEKARAILADILGEIRLDVATAGQVWAEMQMGRHLLVADPSLKVVAGTGFEPVTFGL